MPYGSTGKILHVDLTSGEVWEEVLSNDLYRLFPGGKGLAGFLLLRDLPPGIDPLSPDNVLILANGLLTGAPVATAVRFTAAAKSPLTGGYGESEAGGYWGPELKAAGFEAIEITGRAATPVYLAIIGSRVSIQDAKHLWGQEPDWVEAQIRSELGDKHIRVLQTGLAGENRIRYAGLTHELRHYNGRNGMGAVMGSKLLKACVVRSNGGRYTSNAADPDALLRLGKRLAKEAKNHPQSWDLHEKGTLSLLSGFNAAGMLPTRNFKDGFFSGAERINWEAIDREVLSGHGSCYGCAVRCKPQVKGEGMYGLSPIFGGPEYEAVAGFGSNCGIDDLGAVGKANQLCNRYVMDTISTSATIAFAMECFENGLISLDDTDGIELRFGNSQAMLEVVERIAHRHGIGDILAEGSYRAAQKIGGNAMEYAIQVKGQELAMHEPRGKVAVGLGFAISENGADHLVSVHDTLLQNPESVAFRGAEALGIQKALPARLLDDEKVRYYFLCENWISLGKVLGLCYFGPAPRSFMQVRDVLEVVQAASGWNLDLDDLLEIGERATNLARLFNAREGFTRIDDQLPERLFKPLENGALKGVAYPREEFEQALTELYRLKGWDPDTGMPSREQLAKLGLEFLKYEI
jgi:aldehyde:ferredoxin oxidoreductase